MTGADFEGDGSPDAVAVARMVAQFNEREPAKREAAVRRLIPHPEVAAGPVAEAFCQGPLQRRLAALDLLQEWSAPIYGLDPWRPETLTVVRLQALRAWSATIKHHVIAERSLSKPELAAIGRDIDRLLDAPQSEVPAARERLARYAKALRPEVQNRLLQATTDQARERLTSLRYSLVARPGLEIDWPGGLERLASTNAGTRRQATYELTESAGEADGPLLLEMFSNPDPFVRELSLRALRGLSGPQITAALGSLLYDSDPNVRAAVLKQLAEKPSYAMVGRVADYVVSEKDPDLIVHAVRFLESIHGPASVECLKKLLSHENWRIRAQAVEALSKNFEAGTSEEQKADICVAQIRMLDDPDEFVVSRALQGLERADLGAAVEPIVLATKKHPDLAPDMVRALAQSPTMRAMARRHLSTFCKDANPRVRAAAITGLCLVETAPIDENLRAALEDRDALVRRAAALALMQRIQSWTTQRMAQGKGGGTLAIERFTSGKDRPKWFGEMVDPLLPMLSAKDPEEAVAAARPLVALGRQDKALPVLMSMVKRAPALHDKIAEALHWLPWDNRLALFRLLCDAAAPDQVVVAVNNFVLPEERTSSALWELAAHTKLNPEIANSILHGLEAIYDSDGATIRPYADSNPSSEVRKAVLAAARAHIGSGSEMERMIALGLLAHAVPDDAARSAQEIAKNAHESPAIRSDAFRVLLLCLAEFEARRQAIASLTDLESGIRKNALLFLAFGGQKLSSTDVAFSVSRAATAPGGRFGKAAAKDLNPDILRPLLRDKDPQAAACAGYLLALLQADDGLDTLLDYWRNRAGKDDDWTQLVYRAVAALGDDHRVPILEQIYRRWDVNNPLLGDFYWTIRGLDGPNALRLRRQMRQEIGMAKLGTP
jgi:HEAT repeat protein